MAFRFGENGERFCLRRSLLVVLAALVLGLARPASAAAPCRLPIEGVDDPASPVRTARVAKVIDGDTLVVDTGEEIRLTGIQAPKLPLGRPNMAAWPLADEAKAEVEKLTRGRPLRLYTFGRTVDRHRRTLAQLLTGGEGGVWLQGEMVRRGLARVYTFEDNRACAGALYARERAARAAKRGLWALSYYAIRNSDADLSRDLGTFQLVEGQVTRLTPTARGTYLDFGADYRTDFSAYVGARYLKLFAAEKIDLAALRGQHVRVRGWLDRRNGPQIDVTHPEQIELLNVQ